MQQERNIIITWTVQSKQNLNEKKNKYLNSNACYSNEKKNYLHL